jgi:hypothetical protein
MFHKSQLGLIFSSGKKGSLLQVTARSVRFFSRRSCKKGTAFLFLEPRFLWIPGKSRDYCRNAQPSSQACGHFFMGWKPNPTQPIKLNGEFFTLCGILRFVVASAAEAELGALFLNRKKATIFQLTLEEMSHPQPPTPVNVTIQLQWALQITQ